MCVACSSWHEPVIYFKKNNSLFFKELPFINIKILNNLINRLDLSSNKLTPFQALFYNYLSANTVYIGCAIGIIFVEDMEAAQWIFSVSGATALYISLAVLVSCFAASNFRLKNIEIFHRNIISFRK
jgi:hypothetical protein